jgi:hypothetical protein
MSGRIKAGLLFGLIALIMVPLVSIIPTVGLLICGPVLAIGLAVGAGYLAIRWSDLRSGVGSGVLAGAFTGLGALVGSIVFFVAAIAFVSASPELRDLVFEQALAQNPSAGISKEQLANILPFVGVLLGSCVGLVELVFALGAGALGAWLAVRQRPAEPAAALGSYPGGAPYLPPTAPVSPPVSTPQPPQPPQDPPPLSPLD